MRIACLATNQFEDAELGETAAAMRDAGHVVDVIAPDRQEIRGQRGRVVVAPDASIDEVTPHEFDAVLIPGGHSPDQLRIDDRFVDFVREFDTLERPIFAICHGPQLLLTAGVLEGRTATAWRTVQDDLRRAGIHVLDEEVVIDGHLVTSRSPADVPAFTRAALGMLEDAEPPTDSAPATVGHSPTVH